MVLIFGLIFFKLIFGRLAWRTILFIGTRLLDSLEEGGVNRVKGGLGTDLLLKYFFFWIKNKIPNFVSYLGNFLLSRAFSFLGDPLKSRGIFMEASQFPYMPDKSLILSVDSRQTPIWSLWNVVIHEKTSIYRQWTFLYC